MLAYKGFNKNMTCLNGFQYKEGETYTTNMAVIGVTGFHACLSLVDCFKHYPPDISVYHVVEIEGVTGSTIDDSTVVGKKITIKEEIPIQELGAVCVQSALREQMEDNAHGTIISTKSNKRTIATDSYARIISSGNNAELTATRYKTRVVSSGDSAEINLVQSSATAISTGKYAHIRSNGRCNQVFSFGNAATIESLGFNDKIIANGDRASVRSCGAAARIHVHGKESKIMCFGHDPIVAGEIGTKITMIAKWDEIDKNLPTEMVTFVIDGEKYKPDEYYTVRIGEIAVAYGEIF